MRWALWSTSALLLATVSFAGGRFSSFRPLPEIVATLPGDESGFSREFDDRVRERFPIGSSEDKLLAFLTNENFFPIGGVATIPTQASSFRADSYARKSFVCSGAPMLPGFSRTSGAHTKANAYDRVLAKSKASVVADNGAQQFAAANTKGARMSAPLQCPAGHRFRSWSCT